MRILLDTHLLIWWLGDNRLLPSEARKLIQDPENTIFVSAVSLWEIRLKQSLKKLKVPKDFEAQLAEQEFESLPLTAGQTERVARLPWVHRDPFDRMLVAQAQAEGLVLLTADAVLAEYGSAVRVTR